MQRLDRFPTLLVLLTADAAADDGEDCAANLYSFLDFLPTAALTWPLQIY